jgi:RNA polymerase sigma-70 factor (ECF subfamily)
MPALATAFLDELRSVAPDRAPAAADADALEARLAELCARGRAAFPQLVPDDEAFVRHLAGIEARDGGAPGGFADAAIDDLFLACACARGVAGAADAFDARCTPAIRAAAARVARTSAALDEIVQAVRDAVLVSRAGAPPRIAAYSGKGSLARWAAVTGQRIALMSVRSDRAEARARAGLAAEAPPPADPELAYLKAHYRDEFERALAGLLQGLSERDRAILRLNLVEGLSAERIGKMYGVSRSTAQRWVEDVRESIAGELQRLMRDRVGLSGSGVGSVARLVASQMDLSLSRLLRAG